MTKTSRTIEEQRTILKELFDSIEPDPEFDPLRNGTRRSVGAILANRVFELLTKDPSCWLKVKSPTAEDLRGLRTELNNLTARHLPAYKVCVLVSRDPTQEVMWIGVQRKEEVQ